MSAPTSAGPHAASTRDLILDAALVVLERDGLRSSRMEDVAAEAGVSRQSVYYHFASRDELVAALIDRGLLDLAAAVRTGLDADELEAFVPAAVRFFADNQGVCRLLITEMWGLAGDPEGPRHLVERAETEIVGPLAERIGEATRAGRARCADARLAAQALMGQLAGVALGVIVRGETLDPDRLAPPLTDFARAVLGIDHAATP